MRFHLSWPQLSKLLLCYRISMHEPTTVSGSLSSARSDLIGAWELVDHYAFLPHDKSDTTHPMGLNAKAIIVYTLDGYMSAQFLISKQQLPIPLETDSSCQSLSENFMAYSGEFYLEEGSGPGNLVIMHRARITNLPYLMGETQKRLFKIMDEGGGRYLILESAEPINFSGQFRIIQVKWRRLPDNQLDMA